jgi:hypothetical protein
MSILSAAGTVAVFNAASPKFADLAAANAYAIVLSNTTGADITAGTVTIETASAKADDPCAPDTWAPLNVVPECDALPGSVAGPATITFSATHPLTDGAQCQYAAPCLNQFLRLTGVPTGVDAFVVLTRLKRTLTAA